MSGAVMRPAALELREVVKRYQGPPEVEVLRGVGLTVEEGELLAIAGPSGSGKSTLLHIMGTLDRPTSGSVLVAGQEAGELSDRALSAFRARAVGFVFQQFFLVEGMTALDNVATGLLYGGVPAAERRRRAAEALERVGLGHRMTHRPTELSGGERQRVAIARAVVARPAIVLADEPTGNLDPENARQVLDLFKGQVKTKGAAAILATHSEAAAAGCDRRYRLTAQGLAPVP
jgi:putative ABC transport system ATP-binding protein